ncbi:hypothetical protein DPMN_178459 [Dreissena polymorpha]|uniref:Uncharacterized protein n=1 Tax=Dreissena polymorpha TaxID=45954 RepID=A0A9D4EC84_DREPO|nr:hypothetical protein DPMN_178459 [Dreissena polymorpha]
MDGVTSLRHLYVPHSSWIEKSEGTAGPPKYQNCICDKLLHFVKGITAKTHGLNHHDSNKMETTWLQLRISLMSRPNEILDSDLILDESDASMPWRRRYPRFETRRLNRRLTDESCTGEESLDYILL